jgi:hypothetical protein
VAQQFRYLRPVQQLSDTYFMSLLFRDKQLAAAIVEQRQPVKTPGLAVDDSFGQAIDMTRTLSRIYNLSANNEYHFASSSILNNDLSFGIIGVVPLFRQRLRARSYPGDIRVFTLYCLRRIQFAIF